HRFSLRRQYSPRFLPGFDLGNVGNAISHHSQENAGQPDGQNAERVEDHRLLEMVHLLRSQTENEDVWKRDSRQGNKSVTKEIEGRNSFAGHQGGQGGRRKHSVSGAANSSHAYSDYDDGNHAESQKENG